MTTPQPPSTPGTPSEPAGPQPGGPPPVEPHEHTAPPHDRTAPGGPPPVEPHEHAEPAPVEPPQGAGWDVPARAAWYTERVGRLEARQTAERMLAEILPPAPLTALDLGCGDGRLARLVLASRPTVERVVAVDSSPAMLAMARERLADEPRITVREWDLREPVMPLGRFDVVVSGFAIHHLEHERQRALLTEVAALLPPGGLFANLEVVASATPRRHAEFLAAIGRAADDVDDHLAPVGDQLAWMRAAGLVEVECLWRWRGLALLVGEVPEA